MAKKKGTTMVVLKGGGAWVKRQYRRAAESRGGRALGFAHRHGGLGYIIVGGGILWIFDYIVEHWDWARKDWYIAPILFIAVGWYLHNSRKSPWGIAFFVIGGAMLYRGWKANSDAEKKTETKGPLYLEQQADGSYRMPDTRGPRYLEMQSDGSYRMADTRGPIDDRRAAESIVDRVTRYAAA